MFVQERRWQKVGPDHGLPHAAIYDVEINPATNQTVVSHTAVAHSN